jgi:hypothetical protein
MLRDAEEYIKSFEWCPPIKEMYLGCGVGAVVAVFLFKFAATISGKDDNLWIIEGDLPSAYLVTDDAPDPASALNVYCDIMDEWAQAVVNGSSLEDLFPVTAPATVENACMLLSRTKFVREQVIPKCQGRAVKK